MSWLNAWNAIRNGGESQAPTEAPGRVDVLNGGTVIRVTLPWLEPGEGTGPDPVREAKVAAEMLAEQAALRAEPKRAPYVGDAE